MVTTAKDPMTLFELQALDDHRRALSGACGASYLQLESGQPSNSEADAQKHQHDAGDALSSFSDRFTNASTDPETDLCEHECLGRDQHNSQDQWRLQESERKSDREFVKADGDAETENRHPSGSRKECKSLLLFVALAGDDHEQTQSDQHDDGDQARQVSDDGADDVADDQSDKRHPTLEGHEDQAHPQSLTWSESGYRERGGDREGVEPQRDYERNELQHRDKRRGIVGHLVSVPRGSEISVAASSSRNMA